MGSAHLKRQRPSLKLVGKISWISTRYGTCPLANNKLESQKLAVIFDSCKFSTTCDVAARNVDTHLTAQSPFCLAYFA